MKTRHGWIRSVRKSKALTFLAATDGQEEFQVTIKHDDCEVPEGLTIGASFTVQGEDGQTPRGDYEFKASSIEVVGASGDDYPIQPKFHSPEFLRGIPQSRTRDRRMSTIMWARSHASFALHEFMMHERFFQYFTPIITDSDCEGAGAQFRASCDWLDQHLTVSGQLHGEVGMMGLGQIYTFGPCFRAEKSSTKKHLSEFWMIEPEMAHYDLDMSLDLAERMVDFVLKRTFGLLKAADKLEYLGYQKDFQHPFFSCERVKYDEVCEKFGLTYGEDVGSELEQKIVEHYQSPVFITHWPQELKPFYMKREDGKALCFDLIMPGVGELIGGSVREEDHDTLKAQMVEAGVDPEQMQWYLDTRKWGTVPHAGFGMGFERLVMYITGAEKVHDVIPFPVSY